MRRSSSLVLVLLCALPGCSKEEPTKEAPKELGESSAPSAASAEQAMAGQKETAKQKPEPAAASARTTPYPSDAEWEQVKKEVTVKGSTSLKCETKILDGYLRLHCKKNDLGAPTTLQMKSALPKNALASTGDDALTLIHPFAAGTKIEAVFSWEKESHAFVAEWPKGEARPEIVGVFEGASSPLDRLAPRTEELLPLLAKFQASPKDCLSPVPMWGDLPSYEKVVEVGKKDFGTTSHCSPTVGDDEKPTGGFDCCVSFNEGNTAGDDEGYSSATMMCFKLDEKRIVDEKSLQCHFAG